MDERGVRLFLKYILSIKAFVQIRIPIPQLVARNHISFVDLSDYSLHAIYFAL